MTTGIERLLRQSPRAFRVWNARGPGRCEAGPFPLLLRIVHVLLRHGSAGASGEVAELDILAVAIQEGEVLAQAVARIPVGYDGRLAAVGGFGPVVVGVGRRVGRR